MWQIMHPQISPGNEAVQITMCLPSTHAFEFIECNRQISLWPCMEGAELTCTCISGRLTLARLLDEGWPIYIYSQTCTL